MGSYSYLVGIEHTPEKILPERQRPEYLRGGERGVKEQSHARRPQDPRQERWQQEQVEPVHPHHVALVINLVQGGEKQKSRIENELLRFDK